MESVNDGYHGKYGFVERKEDSRIFVRKTFNKHLIRSLRPRRWLREVRVLRDIRHVNIQCYMESFLCDTHGDIILEYCNYGSLDHFKDYMTNQGGGKIPASFAWHVFKDLVKALCFIHCGVEDIEKMDEEDPYECKIEWTPVLHCDITIDCVFLKTYRGQEYPVVKLGKFNYGVHKSDRDYIVQIPDDAGTEGWVPPEHPHKSERGDVFQAGAVVQCLCDPEWEEASPEDGVLLTDVKELDELVMKAMTPDKHDRPRAPTLARLMLELGRGSLPEHEPVPDEAFERLLPQPY